jgi:hypothetical protein
MPPPPQGRGFSLEGAFKKGLRSPEEDEGREGVSAHAYAEALAGPSPRPLGLRRVPAGGQRPTRGPFLRLQPGLSPLCRLPDAQEGSPYGPVSVYGPSDLALLPAGLAKTPFRGGVSLAGTPASGSAGLYVLAEPRALTGGCFLKVLPGVTQTSVQ